ncbi:MAG: hypothetical protein NZ839_04930 [Endomicrobia bacterium]|nr:hypothetical protein [Endomicrobiia bacterium]
MNNQNLLTFKEIKELTNQYPELHFLVTWLRHRIKVSLKAMSAIFYPNLPIELYERVVRFMKYIIDMRSKRKKAHKVRLMESYNVKYKEIKNNLISTFGNLCKNTNSTNLLEIKYWAENYLVFRNKINYRMSKFKSLSQVSKNYSVDGILFQTNTGKTTSQINSPDVYAFSENFNFLILEQSLLVVKTNPSTRNINQSSTTALKTRKHNKFDYNRYFLFLIKDNEIKVKRIHLRQAKKLKHSPELIKYIAPEFFQ